MSRKLVNDPKTRVGRLSEGKWLGEEKQWLTEGEVIRLEPHATMRDRYYRVTRSGVHPSSSATLKELRDTERRDKYPEFPKPAYEQITKAEAIKSVAAYPLAQTIGQLNQGHVARIVEEKGDYDVVRDGFWAQIADEAKFIPGNTEPTADISSSPTKETPVATKKVKVYTLDQLITRSSRQAKAGGHKLVKWHRSEDTNWSHSRCVRCGGSIVADPSRADRPAWGAVVSSDCEDWIERTQGAARDRYKAEVTDHVDPDQLLPDTEGETTPEMVIEEPTVYTSLEIVEAPAPATDATYRTVYRVGYPGIERDEYKWFDDREDAESEAATLTKEGYYGVEVQTINELVAS